MGLNNRGRTLIAAGSCMVLLLSRPARANGPSSSDLLGGLLISALPAAGGETAFGKARELKPYVLLSWQFCVPLGGFDKWDAKPIRHRLLIAPELADGQFRARFGYRFVYHPIFVGAGATIGPADGIATAVEAGWRFWAFEKTKPNSPNLFVSANVETSIPHEWGRNWRAGAVVGFSFY